MEKIKTINSAERQAYVPASVEVVDITPWQVLCTSGGAEDGQEGNTDGWWTN